MGLDIGKLRLGEQIAGASAVLLLIDTFLPWYSINVPEGPSANAWEIYTWPDLLMLLTVVVVLAWLGMQATGAKVALPVAASVIATGLSAFALVVIVFRVVINQPGPDNRILNNEIGAYLGILLLLALVYGCYVAMKTE